MENFLVAERERMPRVTADAAVTALQAVLTRLGHFQSAVTQRTATRITPRTLDGTSLDG